MALGVERTAEPDALADKPPVAPAPPVAHSTHWRTSRQRHPAVFAAVFASFVAFSGLRSPVPGVNEPHYLAKAKHYWDPAWCRGDFFLESAEAHVAFYQTIGVLTRWFPLEQTAWIGRVLALAVLACGWTALVGRLLPGRWSPWWAACAFLLLAGIGNFSGEWIVGGVEGKVFAYGLLFWAAALVPDRLVAAAVCAGLAVSFHPVVGLWGLAATVPGVAWVWWSRTRSDGRPACRPGSGVGNADLTEAGGERASVTETAGGTPAATSARMAAAVLVLVACAVPGLAPAVWMLATTSPEIAAEANRIQVFDRLEHHLDPHAFSASAYVCYGLLIAFWLVGRRFAEHCRAERGFGWWVAGSVLIALGGLAVGLRLDDTRSLALVNARAALLKFYPFRLADVLVPLAASVVFVGLAQRWTHSESWPRYRLRPAVRRGLLWPAFGAALAIALVLPAADRNSSRLPPEIRADWLDVCRWVSQHAPRGAEFLTPRESWAFKWYARRPEYVTRKDCPQDAAGIIEWRRRMNTRDTWLEWLRYALWAWSFPEALDRLGDDTGVTHVIVPAAWRPPVPSAYRNQTYAVLAIGGHGAGEPQVDPP